MIQIQACQSRSVSLKNQIKDILVSRDVKDAKDTSAEANSFIHDSCNLLSDRFLTQEDEEFIKAGEKAVDSKILSPKASGMPKPPKYKHSRTLNLNSGKLLYKLFEKLLKIYEFRVKD